MSWGLNNVTVLFGDHMALDEVDIPVNRGQVTAVVGGDGAGKTTVARTIVGLVRPVSGTVGRPHACGFQPASSGTWRDMTVRENLRFVADAFAMGSRTRDERTDQLLEATQLHDAIDRLAGNLSGGMRQKLGVAMALLPEPDMVVLDEPTTGVDPVSRLEISAFISSAAQRGTAVLATTTYVDEAARAGHVIALDRGSVLASGNPAEVVASLPGAMFASNSRQGANCWRRGRQWRVWSADGSPPPNSNPVLADLDDVITVAALGRESGS